MIRVFQEQTNTLSEQTAPSLLFLRAYADVKNVFDSPCVQTKERGDVRFYTYQDDSILIHDTSKSRYYFISGSAIEFKQLLIRKSDEVLGQTIPSAIERGNLTLLGEGSFSSVFTNCENVNEHLLAMKMSTLSDFNNREAQEARSEESTRRDVASHTTVKIHKMSLVDFLRVRNVLANLEEVEVKQPDFFGFCLSEDVDSNEVCEVQFMEAIDCSSLEEIAKAVHSLNFDGISEDIKQLVTGKFLGSQDVFLLRLIMEYNSYYSSVQEAVRGKLNGQVGDIEYKSETMTKNRKGGDASNVLVRYDAVNKSFEFILIDVTELEEVERPGLFQSVFDGVTRYTSTPLFNLFFPNRAS